MKKIRYSLLAVLAALVAFVGTSCTDLSETVHSSLTDENLDFTDEGTLEAMSASVYANLRFMYWGYYGLMDLTEEACDLYVMPSKIGIGWGDYYISYHKHEVTSENANMHSTDWYYNYVAITYANQFCRAMEGVKEKQGGELTESQNFMLAKIRCLRALSYYILFDNFRWIPLLTGAEEEQEAGYLPSQANPDTVFDWVEQELLAIRDDLGTAHVYGHPNRFVADMILAKMYLNHNAWFENIISADELREGKQKGDTYRNRISDDWYKKCELMVKDVIDNGGYTLEPNFKDNFKANLSNCTECIFAIPLDKTYASHNYTVCESLITAGAAAYGFTNSCWNGGAGIPQFIDTYHPNDTRFDDTWAHDQQYAYTETGGPQSGDPLTTAEADLKGTVNVFYTKNIHSVDDPGVYMLEGYRNVKLEIVPGTDGTWGDDVNFFRLADAYLMAAECALRLKGAGTYKESDAVNFVNKVRERAFKGRDTKTFKVPADPEAAKRTLADLKGGSCYNYGHSEYHVADGYDPAKYTSYSWDAKYYDEGPAEDAPYRGGQDIELGGLLDELAWEFVFEHHRRQDLIRFKMENGQNVWNGKSWFCKDRVQDITDTHYNAGPIYVDYMNGNKNLVQMPGFN
ncbi:MAG: RagB/SusD family nutrient uptake outer membrane protein [Bacteroidaceae bacterium]|nr:RagB/SusD family nutrient uptake outer membrane protein [Bacteroidaceae bacterium]